MTDTTTVPSDNSTPYVLLVGTVVRALLALMGGIGIAWAQGVTGDQITMIVSLLMALGSLAWGIYQKFATSWREHQIAVMSARGGKAVQPEKVIP